MNYRGGRQDVGVKAEDLDPKITLLQDLTDAITKPPKLPVTRGVAVPEGQDGKIGQDEANYVEKGTYPWVCGSCSMWVFGGDTDLCTLVEGEINVEGTCRYFEAR